MFEVVRFRAPVAGAEELAPAANRPGLRHVAFNVDDVRGVVDRLRLCYVRGPEGLIVELAERIGGSHNDMTAAANVAAQAPSDRE